MSSFCPNGHPSDEPDYCSVCGAPMGGAAASGGVAQPQGATAAPAPDPAGPACPSCGTVRTDPGARYCEVCRYDYEARTPGPPPVVEVGPAPSPPPAPPPVVSGPADWEVTISVDPTLDVDPEPDAPAPADLAERMFPIDLTEMLIGRRDDRQGVRPEIPIFDPAVSRRHAKLLRLPDGGLAILDLASANGTAVNGEEIAAGERHPLADGDSVTMGRWTRLAVHRK